MSLAEDSIDQDGDGKIDEDESEPESWQAITLM